MTDHPDIDELFADTDRDDDDPGGPDPGAVDHTPHPGADDDAGDEDLLVLVDEASARTEQRAEQGADVAPAPVVEAPAVEAPVVEATADDEPDGDAADGMSVQFPSNDFPPPPAFRLRVPKGWLAVPVPDALMAVREPAEHDGFHANVVVRNRRVVAAPDPESAIVTLRALDSVPDGMELLGDDVNADGPTPARRLQLRFTAPGGRLLQAQHLMVYIPVTEQVANLLTVVGTWRDDAPSGSAALVQRTVASLRLFLPPPG
ncbi:MAG: hypothetical protein ACK5OX_11110 [Desertimonas sp.]